MCSVVDASLKLVLDPLVVRFERAALIEADPVSVPHGFQDPADQEVIGVFAALFAWGRRATVLAKLEDLCGRMDYRPHAFVYNYNDARDAHRLEGFCHRTINGEDVRGLIIGLRAALHEFGTLENAFSTHLSPDQPHIGAALEGFGTRLRNTPGVPARLHRHLSLPSTKSACKRICMYVRWMVRPGPFDLGLWSSITPAQLILPLDVHSGRMARKCGLLTRRANDWQAALELTEACRRLDSQDPTRYDFALFGAGAYGAEEEIPELPTAW